MRIPVTLTLEQVEEIVVRYLVESMDDIERDIIHLEKQARAGRLTIDSAEILGDSRDMFCNYEKILKDIGYTYDDAAEQYNIPTLRRDEKFTAN